MMLVEYELTRRVKPVIEALSEIKAGFDDLDEYAAFR
jgi:hypothetical protein